MSHSITARDYDAEGNITDEATPRYAHDHDAARLYMIIEAGMMARVSGYRVAELSETCIRLERRDGSGGTSFTIEEVPKA